MACIYDDDGGRSGGGPWRDKCLPAPHITSTVQDGHAVTSCQTGSACGGGELWGRDDEHL